MERVDLGVLVHDAQHVRPLGLCALERCVAATIHLHLELQLPPQLEDFSFGDHAGLHRILLLGNRLLRDAPALVLALAVPAELGLRLAQRLRQLLVGLAQLRLRGVVLVPRLADRLDLRLHGVVVRLEGRRGVREAAHLDLGLVQPRRGLARLRRRRDQLRGQRLALLPRLLELAAR